MRRLHLFGIACGLLVGGGLYALHEERYLPRVFSSRERGKPPVTEFEQFERTADGKPICPRCGRTSHVLQYRYGLTREAPGAGRIDGGCAVSPESPEYYCRRCNTNFGFTSFGK